MKQQNSSLTSLLQPIKTRYDLVPQHGLDAVCQVLTEKLERYKANQWKAGLPWTEVLSNLKEHLAHFEMGQDFTEKNLLHMAEVAMNALIICDYYKTYPQGDDRIIVPVNKPIVALDIDDVCLDFSSAFTKRFGVELNPYWEGHYQMAEMLKELQTDKEFWINIPAKNIPSFEPDLYITSRSIPDDWTRESLQRAGLPCAPVYSVPWNTSKVDLLKAHNVTVMIDDKWANYKEATDAGVFCYLMDAPHNQHYNVGHRRIYDLNLNIK